MIKAKVLVKILALILFSNLSLFSQFDFSLSAGINSNSKVKSKEVETISYNFTTEKEDTLLRTVANETIGFNLSFKLLYKIKQFEIQTGVNYYIPEDGDNPCRFSNFDPEVLSTGVGSGRPERSETSFAPLWSVELGAKYFLPYKLFNARTFGSLNFKRIEGHRGSSSCLYQDTGYAFSPGMGFIDKNGVSAEFAFTSFSNQFSIIVGYRFLNNIANKFDSNEIIME